MCNSKDRDVIELMDLEQEGIHVSEYWLKLPPKDVLQTKLYRPVAQAQARIGYAKDTEK